MSKPHDSEFIGRRNFLKRATFVGAAVVTPELAVNAQRPSRNPVTQIPDELTADEDRNLLKLEPRATCGFVRVTFMSKEKIAPGRLPAPFAAGRPAGSALYFMVTPGAPVRLHRIRNDQLYHYYLGDPLEVLMLHVDGTTAHVVVGPDLRGGQLLQLLIPGNTFPTARVTGRNLWFPGAGTEAPVAEPVQVESGTVGAPARR